MTHFSSKKIVTTLLILFGLAIPTITYAKEKISFNDVYRAYQSAVETGNKKQILIHAQDAFELGIERFGKGYENTIALQYNLALAQSAMRRGDLAHQNLQQVKLAYSDIHGKLSLDVFDVVLEQMDNLKSFPYKLRDNSETKDIALELIDEAEIFWTKLA